MTLQRLGLSLALLDLPSERDRAPRADEVEMTKTAMVVMEQGSDWPGRIGDATNVVAFSPGSEDPLPRTRERLLALHRSNQSVNVAAIAYNAAAGVTVGRAQLARVLLDAVSNETSGRLILSAPERACPELRDELLSLAGALTAELRGSSASVSLRFV